MLGSMCEISPVWASSIKDEHTKHENAKGSRNCADREQGIARPSAGVPVAHDTDKKYCRRYCRCDQTHKKSKGS